MSGWNVHKTAILLAVEKSPVVRSDSRRCPNESWVTEQASDIPPDV
jgi:hypothetical protein